MGKGIALEFKRRFPTMFNDYVRKCAVSQVVVGQPYVFKRAFTPWILNFPTKDHWRSRSRLPDIVAGLEYLKQHCAEWEITSLAVPALGCGYGQLEWDDIKLILRKHLDKLKIDVELYMPQ